LSNELSNLPEPEDETFKPKGRTKRYLLIGILLVAIIAVASIISVTQFLPSVSGELVSVGMNYEIGEKMTYNIKTTVELMTMPISSEYTLQMEILNFDGENYTIKQTMTIEQQEFSYTMKINKMGQIVEYNESAVEMDEAFSSLFDMSGYGAQFTSDEVRVGESWEIPIDITEEGISLQGTLSYMLSEITTVTVPAGTYDVLKIEAEISDLQTTTSIEELNMQTTSNMDGYALLEKDSCMLIEFTLQQVTTVTAMGETSSIKTNMQMQLVEHTK
jgi:hypothetical protein